MNSYKIAGLVVRSEIALPGLIVASTQAECDARIARRAVPLRLDDAQASGPTWQMRGDEFLLRVPGVARFLLVGGREIDFETENGTPDSEVAIFLIGTVLGILLHQRGQIVLHASAVRVGGKAVLFCGPSGAGKSTIAAALVRQGYPLVADDLCAVMLRDGAAPMVQPDGRQLKLWAEAVDKLGLGENRGDPVRAQLQKYYVEPGDSSVEALPLGAVYFLRETRAPYKDGIERPNVVDCAALLRRNAYRPMLIRNMNQKENYFHAAAAITRSNGIFHLTRAFDFDRLPEGVSRLRDHWAELGLVEPATV